jgi:hypothetical protein
MDTTKHTYQPGQTILRNAGQNGWLPVTVVRVGKALITCRMSDGHVKAIHPKNLKPAA